MTQEESEQQEEGISCKLDSFAKYTCSPEPTGILFLGRETENPDEIVNTVMEAEFDERMNFGVLDLADDSCQELSEKYKIDRDATQMVIFQDCEKISGISLEGDHKEQIAKLKASLEQREKGNR